MSFIPSELRDYLLNLPAISDYVGDRVHDYVFIPVDGLNNFQTVKDDYPNIIISLLSDERESTLGGFTGDRLASVQITISEVLDISKMKSTNKNQKLEANARKNDFRLLTRAVEEELDGFAGEMGALYCDLITMTESNEITQGAQGTVQEIENALRFDILYKQN